MAYILKRDKRLVVVHMYIGPSGARRQHWEFISDKAIAEERKVELEALALLIAQLKAVVRLLKGAHG